MGLTSAEHSSRWDIVVAYQRRPPSIASLRFDFDAGNEFSDAYAVHCVACTSCSKCHIRMAFRRYGLWKIERKRSSIYLLFIIGLRSHQKPFRSPDMFHQIVLDGEVFLAYIAFVRLFTCKNFSVLAVWIVFGVGSLGTYLCGCVCVE